MCPYVRNYPAFLIQEPQADNPQPARVAYINAIQKTGREYRIDYLLTTDISPIPSDVIVELLGDIG